MWKCHYLVYRYDNLFLSPDLENWQDMETDMDITDFIRARNDYIMWQTEKRLSIQDDAFKRQICEKNIHNPIYNNIIHIHRNHFFKKNGDIIGHIKCSHHLD